MSRPSPEPEIFLPRHLTKARLRKNWHEEPPSGAVRLIQQHGELVDHARDLEIQIVRLEDLVSAGEDLAATALEFIQAANDPRNRHAWPREMVLRWSAHFARALEPIQVREEEDGIKGVDE